MIYQPAKKGKLGKIRANKRLGQHFLVNPQAIETILDALKLTNGDTVIEIGPGNGELTLPLIKRLKNYANVELTALEKDQTLADRLEKMFHTLSLPNSKIITGDALPLLPAVIASLPAEQSYKLVGNIPYYITGKLLRLISELPRKPDITVLTIQKEVAERICAKPPKMNLLAAATQFWADPKILMRLKSSDFNPPPKIDSAIIKLRTLPIDPSINANTYYKLLHILFKQPRKTILNNLRTENHNHYDINEEINAPILNLRPQNLSIKEILKLMPTID